jgi:hypothetical protein
VVGHDPVPFHFSNEVTLATIHSPVNELGLLTISYRITADKVRVFVLKRVELFVI